MLCQASPERGGWLGGGPFVGEVVGGDSLSLATSSPTCTNTHADRQTHSEVQWGFRCAGVRLVRQREVNTVYTTVTCGIKCVAFQKWLSVHFQTLVVDGLYPHVHWISHFVAYNKNSAGNLLHVVQHKMVECERRQRQRKISQVLTMTEGRISLIWSLY